ncbi:MAG: hypothetical protein LBH68_04490, partial [Bifidobacteriaceae bacterium]|nr:hypothetical protein [Bifidobacteriaceae bacterium]
MSQRPPFIAPNNALSGVRRNLAWMRPIAMVAAGAAALTGMVLAQGLTAAQQAAAAGPPPSPALTTVTVTPTPDPLNPPLGAGYESFYTITVSAQGLPSGGGAAEPSAERAIQATVRGLEGQLEYAAGFLENHHTNYGQYEAAYQRLEASLDAAGSVTLDVLASQPGAYLVEVQDSQTGEVFASQQLDFGPPRVSARQSSVWENSPYDWNNGYRDAVANMGDPALAETPELWDYWILDVQVIDETDRRVEDEAPPLSVAAAATDPFGGEGLEFSNGGVFHCRRDVVSQDCVRGNYQIEVYSAKAGIRQLEVTYGEPGDRQFKVLYHGGRLGMMDATVVPVEFVAQQDPESSTLVFSPSDRPGDPAGEPLPIPVGSSYQITYTAWDAGRNNPVPGFEWSFGLDDEDCPATFESGLDYLSGATDLQGQISQRITSVTPGTCVLRDPLDQEHQLVWVDDSVDPDTARSWFSVTPDAVMAGGEDEGSLEVQLRGVGGAPVTGAAAGIEVVVPSGSGMSVSDFTHFGQGRYLASFTGTEVGAFTVGINLDGTPIAVQPGIGNGTATFVAAGSPPSPASSRAFVSQLDGQKANHDAPGSTSREWGRQLIRAALKDASGEPITAGAGSLVAAVAPGDFLGGLGLYFGNEGRFACEEVPVDGVCGSGVYVLPVYSSKAGERQLTVTYLPGEPEQVVLVNGDQPSSAVLRTVFTAPPPSAGYSTLTVSPSLPVDDPDDPLDRPDGAPLPRGVSDPAPYRVAVTVWDEGRNNRVAGQEVVLELREAPGGSCYSSFPLSGNSTVVTTSAAGRIVTEIYSFDSVANQACELWAFLGSDDGAETGLIGGAPKDLSWRPEEPSLGLDGPGGGASSYYPGGENVPADGVTLGWVSVRLADRNWIPVSGQADKLELVAPEGSGIETRGVFEDTQGAGHEGPGAYFI